MPPQLQEIDVSKYTDEQILRFSDFYKPWPHQEEFHRSSAKYRLQVGGFGSGKSRPLLMEAVRHANDNPGANVILIRKTMPDLKRTVIDKFKTDIPKRLYEYGSQEVGTYNESDHIVYFRPTMVQKWETNPDTGETKFLFDNNGKPVMWLQQSKLQFAACEKESDISKFLSTEYLFIGFEELGEFPFFIWDAFAGRNRCPIPNTRACMAGATNPMGVGWGWIKRLWVDKLPAHGMDPNEFNEDDYEYFHSTVENNPIYRKNKEYVSQLKRSPLRDRIYLGKLDAVSGQFFDNWIPSMHVKKMDDFVFEPWQPWWVGWDYGFGHYATVTFWTKAQLKPRFEGEKPRLVNVTVKELVMNGADPDKLVVEEQAQKIIELIPKIHDDDGRFMGYQWNIAEIYFSWERFIENTKNKRGDVTSIAEQANEVLSDAGLPIVSRSSTNREAGWSKMYSMLDSSEWFVIGGNNGCPHLAEAIPLLVRGDGVKVSLEDVVKPPGLSLEDDIGDSARYAVAGFLLAPGEKPKEVKLAEELDEIKDPMRRHMHAYRQWLKENHAQTQQKPPGETIIPSWVNRIRPRK